LLSAIWMIRTCSEAALSYIHIPGVRHSIRGNKKTVLLYKGDGFFSPGCSLLHAGKPHIAHAFVGTIARLADVLIN